MAKMVSIHEAKTHLSRLLAMVQAGETVVIAKNRQPIARLVPFAEGPRDRPFGLYGSRVAMHPDWDAPLPPDVAEAFGS